MILTARYFLQYWKVNAERHFFNICGTWNMTTIDRHRYFVNLFNWTSKRQCWLAVNFPSSFVKFKLIIVAGEGGGAQERKITLLTGSEEKSLVIIRELREPNQKVLLNILTLPERQTENRRQHYKRIVVLKRIN